MSHPSWVCGLKPILSSSGIGKSDASHPSWVCGLKHEQSLAKPNRYIVTPFVGVWIETYCLRRIKGTRIVTPFVGVWIETCRSCADRLQLPSHPSWVCGLKPTVYAELRARACHTLRGCVD